MFSQSRFECGAERTGRFVTLVRPSGPLAGKLAERRLHVVIGHAIDLSFSNETAPDGFVDRLFQLAAVHVTRPQQIDYLRRGRVTRTPYIS